MGWNMHILHSVSYYYCIQILFCVFCTISTVHTASTEKRIKYQKGRTQKLDKNANIFIGDRKPLSISCVGFNGHYHVTVTGTGSQKLNNNNAVPI